MLMEHFPSTRGSYIDREGMHWTQKRVQAVTDMHPRMPMASQMVTLCQVVTTIRSKNSPMDHFASDMPGY